VTNRLLYRRREFITLLVTRRRGRWRRAQQAAIPVVGFLRSASVPEPDATLSIQAPLQLNGGMQALFYAF
jgi:hypothetical protein